MIPGPGGVSSSRTRREVLIIQLLIVSFLCHRQGATLHGHAVLFALVRNQPVVPGRRQGIRHVNRGVAPVGHLHPGGEQRLIDNVACRRVGDHDRINVRIDLYIVGVELHADANLNQTDTQCCSHGVPAIGDRKLVQDVRDVVAHGAAAEEEPVRNLLVCVAPGYVEEHFSLSMSQDALRQQRWMPLTIRTQGQCNHFKVPQLIIGAFQPSAS